MRYKKIVILKDGRACILRNGTQADGQAAWELFDLTHRETDYLLSYPEENSYTPEQEAQFLQAKSENAGEVEILAELDGRPVGLAGIERVGAKEKVRHRAALGISVAREAWGLGIGRALTEACIECAREAGYAQLELDAVADNDRALALYRSEGFVEYGRNPKGFRSREAGWQELVLMRLDLSD